ncbi:DMT family transporter [Microbacterium gorillae]|uniref:DMT family transporter n=1 Tax=Microbacterium gorillae TaxID=1231063 RepID=UPI00058EBE33|nr:DMT family transporter [Microbacterium gorillae]
MTPADPHAPRLPLWLALLGAVLIGVLTAAQARINGALGVELHSGFVAAFVSFGSGLVLMAVVSALIPAGRAGARSLVRGLRERRIPPWMVLGGVAGALTVATQGLTVGIIGVSLFTVGVVAGQALCGLVIDRIGYGPAGVVAVTVARLIGGVLALAAVVVSLTGDVLGRTAWWMLLLPFGAGVGIAWQQATNGRLGRAVGTPLTATLVNFIGGTAVLGVAALISVAVTGPTAPFPTDAWFYIGGAMGVVYIFLGAALVARTGVLLLGLGSVVGQILTSLVIDAIWPALSGPDAWHATAMGALALASVVVAASPWHRLRPRRASRA